MVVYQRRPGSRARRAGSRRRGSYPRRQPLWVRHSIVGQALPINAPRASDLVPGTSLDEGARVGSTVVRVRVHYTFSYDTSLADPVSGFFFGAGIFPVDILAPGNEAQIPRPLEDRNDWDWLMWDHRYIADGFVGTGVVEAAQVMNGNYHFDVKSSRRIAGPHDTLIFVAQPSLGSLVNDHLVASVLLKLS